MQGVARVSAEISCATPCRRCRTRTTTCWRFSLGTFASEPWQRPRAPFSCAFPCVSWGHVHFLSSCIILCACFHHHHTHTHMTAVLLPGQRSQPCLWTLSKLVCSIFRMHVYSAHCFVLDPPPWRCRVAQKSRENKMSASNLSVVFGPTLMRPREETMTHIMNIQYQNVVGACVLRSLRGTGPPVRP